LFKKKKFIIKVVPFLIAFASIAPHIGGSVLFIGEPQLPKKMLREDDQFN